MARSVGQARDESVTVCPVGARPVSRHRGRYGTGAEVTGQLSRTAAMAHRDIVMRVAFKAQATRAHAATAREHRASA